MLVDLSSDLDLRDIMVVPLNIPDGRVADWERTTSWVATSHAFAVFSIYIRNPPWGQI